MKSRRVGWAAFVVLTLVLYFFENNTGTRIVLTGAIVIPTLSVLYAAFSSQRIYIRLEVPDRVRSGGPLYGTVHCSHRALAGITAEAVVVATHSILDVRNRYTVRLNAGGRTLMTIPDVHCGAVELALEKGAVRDLFGLCSFPFRAEQGCLCIVEPSEFPVDIHFAHVDDVMRQEAEAEQSERGLDPFEVSGFRAYQPGDDPRGIHWKLSARFDQILFREGNRPEGTRFQLAVDPKTDPEDLDDLLSALSSVSEALSEMGIAYIMGGRSVTDETEREVALCSVLMGETGIEWDATLHLLYFSNQTEDSVFPSIRVTRICTRADCMNGNAALVNTNQRILELNG